MKVIVVAGAHSGIGKTTLVRELASLLDHQCVAVKIGHGNDKPGKNEMFFHTGTTYAEIREKIPATPFLIIESNSILRELTPDLLLYLNGVNPKPSAAFAHEKADIVSGTAVSANVIDSLSCKLGFSKAIIRKIAWLTGARPAKVQGILLAGGRSSRMGTDKSLLTLGNATLAERIIKTISPLCDDLLISTRAGQAASVNGYCTVNDVSPDKGPLMGIYSALEASCHQINIVVPCDIPKLHPSLIRKLLSFTDEYDIVVPSFAPGTVEPLLGIYRKECSVHIKKLLEENVLRVSELFTRCRTIVVEFGNASWYANLNTPEEFATYVKEHPDDQ